MKCRICDTELIQPVRGRPRTYCSDECRNLDARIQQTIGLIDEAKKHMTDEARKALRSRLWSIANQLNEK